MYLRNYGALLEISKNLAIQENTGIIIIYRPYYLNTVLKRD